MMITIAPGVRLFVDVEGPSHVPDGPRLREKRLNISILCGNYSLHGTGKS